MSAVVVLIQSVADGLCDAMAAACAEVELVYPVGDDGALTGDNVDDPLDDGPLRSAARVGNVMRLPGTVGGKDGSRLSAGTAAVASQAGLGRLLELLARRLINGLTHVV